MKELKKKLLSLAQLHLTDEEYKRIESYINMDAITSLRVFLGDLAEVYEIKNMIEQKRTEEWLTIDEMNDIALEMAILKNDEKIDEGIVRSRRKRISTGFKAVVQ